MKRDVIDDYPVEKLPHDLRGGRSGKDVVTVIVQDAPAKAAVDSTIMKYWGAASYLGTTQEEAVARVRALRDEWD